MTAAEKAQIDKIVRSEQKEVFIMNEFEDLSFNEISERTVVGVNTLLSRKRYAVLILRNKLKELNKRINT